MSWCSFRWNMSRLYQEQMQYRKVCKNLVRGHVIFISSCWEFSHLSTTINDGMMKLVIVQCDQWTNIFPQDLWTNKKSCWHACLNTVRNGVVIVRRSWNKRKKVSVYIMTEFDVSMGASPCLCFSVCDFHLIWSSLPCRSTGMQDDLVFLLDESLTSIQLFALHM